MILDNKLLHKLSSSLQILTSIFGFKDYPNFKHLLDFSREPINNTRSLVAFMRVLSSELDDKIDTQPPEVISNLGTAKLGCYEECEFLESLLDEDSRVKLYGLSKNDILSKEAIRGFSNLLSALVVEQSDLQLIESPTPSDRKALISIHHDISIACLAFTLQIVNPVKITEETKLDMGFIKENYRNVALLGKNMQVIDDLHDFIIDLYEESTTGVTKQNSALVNAYLKCGEDEDQMSQLKEKINATAETFKREGHIDFNKLPSKLQDAYNSTLGNLREDINKMPVAYRLIISPILKDLERGLLANNKNSSFINGVAVSVANSIT